MEHEKPRIPDHLLNNCSDADRWMMESVFSMKNDVSDLKESVSRVEELQKIANGRTSKLEGNVNALNDQIKSWNSVKNFSLKLVKNKYFLISIFALLFIGFYPLDIFISHNGGMVATIVKVFKLFAS